MRGPSPEGGDSVAVGAAAPSDLTAVEAACPAAHEPIRVMQLRGADVVTVRVEREGS